MPINRIACNFLIQRKLVANYKPRERGVGLTPGALEKNYAKYFCFRWFTQKPIKSTVTTHHKHYDNHTPRFNCIVREFSNVFISRIVVVV